MFFSVITKKLNWEILTKNLVTFKRWDGVKDENFEYYGDSLKNTIFVLGEGGGFTKNQYISVNCLKRGAWPVCRSKGGVTWQKRGGGVFEGLDTPINLICI